MKILRNTFEILRLSIAMLKEHWRGNKNVVVYIEEPGFIQYLLPIIEQLQNINQNLTFYLAHKTPSTTVIDSFPLIPVSRIFQPTIASRLMYTDIWLSPSVYGRGPSSAKRINISHNLPVKVETYPLEEVKKYDVHFLTGPLQRMQYENMFAKLDLDLSKFVFYDIGYPKLDNLLQGKFNKEKVLPNLGLDVNKPTILYAPAWDPGASLRENGVEIVEEILKLNDCNILVKLHPVSYTPESSPDFNFYTGGVNWIEKLQVYEARSNFRHVNEYSINPLLAAADVMVTDISSVALEYMLLDKPIIYIDCPEFFNKTLKQWGQDPDLVRNDARFNAGRDAGIVIKEITDLGKVIRQQLADPDQLAPKRKRLSSQMLYNPGHGAEIAAETIVQILN